MKYDELLGSRRVRREPISRREMRQVMALAERDLRTAQKIGPEERDWGFAIAYNAVLQASRAYMFSQGYRPASADSHKNTFAFMRVALGQKHQSLVTYFDRMRRKRHQAVYDQVGVITATEAKNMLAKAEDFVNLVGERLAGEG